MPLSTSHFETFDRKKKYFNGVFSRDSFKEDNERLEKKFYVINIDEETGPGTHWVVLFMSTKSVPICCYVDSFDVYPLKALNFSENLFLFHMKFKRLIPEIVDYTLSIS